MADFTVSDELAVRTTLARYCHRCDDGDFTGLAELFTPDGVFNYAGRTCTGRAAIVEFFQGSQARPEQRGKHLTANIAVEPAGDDRVRVASDFLFLRRDGSRLVPAITGRYDDELVRVDGRWLFARRDALPLG